MVYRSFQEQARTTAPSGVSGIGQVVQPGEILAEEDMQFKFQPPQGQQSTLGKIGSTIAAVDKPISERLGFQIPEMRGPLDEIGNFVLREGSRPTNLLFALPGAGWGAKGALTAGRAATKAANLARFGGRTPTLGRGVAKVAEPLSRFAVGATEPFGTFGGRLPYRIGAEMGGGVLMAGLSRSAMDAIPEDAHWSVKLATGLGAGLLAGGMAAKAGMYLPTKFPGLVNQQAMAKVWAARSIAEVTKNAALRGIPNQSMQGQIKDIEGLALKLADQEQFTLNESGYPTPIREGLNQSALEAIDRPTLLDGEDGIISPDLSGPRLSRGFDFEAGRYEANLDTAIKASQDASNHLKKFKEGRENYPDPFKEFERLELYDEAPPLYEQIENVLTKAYQNPEGEEGLWLTSLRNFLVDERNMGPLKAESYLQDFANADRFLAESTELELGLLKPRADDAFKVNNLDGKRVSIWDKSITSNLNNKKINAAVTEVIRNNPDQFDIRKTLPLPLTGRGAENPYADSNEAIAKYLEMDEAAPELEVQRLSSENAFDTMTDIDRLELTPGSAIAGKGYLENLKALNKFLRSRKETQEFDLGQAQLRFPDREDQIRLTANNPNTLDAIRKSPSKAFFDNAGNVLRIYKRQENRTRFADVQAKTAKGNMPRSQSAKIDDVSIRITDPALREFLSNLYARIKSGDAKENAADLIMRDIDTYENLSPVAKQLLDASDAGRPTKKQYLETIRSRAEAKEFIEKDDGLPDLSKQKELDLIEKQLGSSVEQAQRSQQTAENILVNFLGHTPSGRPGQWYRSADGAVEMRLDSNGNLDDVRWQEPEALRDGVEEFQARQLEKQQLIEEGELKPNQALPEDRYGITTRGLGAKAIVDLIADHGMKTVQVPDSGPMSAFYQELGFQEIGRTPFENARGALPDWDVDLYGRPDIITLAYMGGLRKGVVNNAGRITDGIVNKVGEFGEYQGTRNIIENLSEAQGIGARISELSEKYGGKRFNQLFDDSEAAGEFALLSRETGPSFDELAGYDRTSVDDPGQRFQSPVPEYAPKLNRDMKTFIKRNRGAIRATGSNVSETITLSRVVRGPKGQFESIAENYVIDRETGNLISEDLQIEIGEQLDSWGKQLGRTRTAAKALAIERQRAQNDWNATQPPEDPSLLDRMLSNVVRGRFNPNAAALALDYTQARRQIGDAVSYQKDKDFYEARKGNLAIEDRKTGIVSSVEGLIQVRPYVDYAGVRHEGLMTYVPPGKTIKKTVMTPDGERIEAVVFDARDPEVWGAEGVDSWNNLMVPLERVRIAEEMQLDDAGRSITQFDLAEAAQEQRRVGQGIKESGWIPLGDFIENSNLHRTPDGSTLLGSYGLGRQFQFTETIDVPSLRRGGLDKTQFTKRTGRAAPGFNDKELQFNIQELAFNNQSLDFSKSLTQMIATRLKAGLDSLNAQNFKNDVSKIGTTAYEQLAISNPGLLQQHASIMAKLYRAIDPDNDVSAKAERKAIDQMDKYATRILNKVENELDRMANDKKFDRFSARELQANMREINDAMLEFSDLNLQVERLVIQGRQMRGRQQVLENQLTGTSSLPEGAGGRVVPENEIFDLEYNPGRKRWLENNENYIRAQSWDKILQRLTAQITVKYNLLAQEFAQYGLPLPESLARLEGNLPGQSPPTSIGDIGRTEVDRLGRAAERNLNMQVEEQLQLRGLTEDAWPLRLPVKQGLASGDAPYYVTDEIVVGLLESKLGPEFYRLIKDYYKSTSSPRYRDLQLGEDAAKRRVRAHIAGWYQDRGLGLSSGETAIAGNRIANNPELVTLVLEGMSRGKIKRDVMTAILENPHQSPAIGRLQVELLSISKTANDGQGIQGREALEDQIDSIGRQLSGTTVEFSKKIKNEYLNLNKLYIDLLREKGNITEELSTITQLNADQKINVQKAREGGTAERAKAIEKIQSRDAMQISTAQYNTKKEMVRYAQRMFNQTGAFNKYIKNVTDKQIAREKKRADAFVTANKELIEVTEDINQFVTRFNNQLGLESLSKLAPQIGNPNLRVMPDVAREFASNAQLMPQEAPTGPLKIFSDLNAEMRQISATLDFSGTAIQGIFAAGAHPIEFAKAWTMVTKSVVADNDAWYNWMKANEDLIDEYLRLGGVWTHPGGSEEFFLRANTPVISGISRITNQTELTRKLGETLGKGRDLSNMHFSRIGNANRMLMFKKWREGKGFYKLLKNKEMPIQEQREVVKMINAATGYASDYNPGTIAQAALFAPRFFASQLKMLSGAATRNDTAGQLARSLMMTTIMTGAVIVESLNSALGEETDWRPIKFTRQGTAYWNTNFMRIRNVGGRDVSLFGPYDSLAGLLVTGMAQGPESMITKGLRQKASPISQRVYDAFQGSDFYGNKITFNMLNDTSGTINTVRNMAQNSYTPFYVSDVTEDIVDGRTSVGSIPLAAGAFLGLKTSPMSLSEVMQKDVIAWVDELTPEIKMELGLIYEDGGTLSEMEITKYSDLTGAAQAAFNEVHPDNKQRLTENLERLATSGDVAAISRLNKIMIEETAERDQEALADAFLRWRGNVPDPNLGYVVPVDISKILAEITNIRYRSWKARKTQDEFFETEITNSTSDNPTTQAVSRYYDAMDSSSVPGTNEVVWPEFNRKVGELYKEFTPEQIAMIENRSPAKIHPVFQPYWDARQRVNQSEYYRISDQIYQNPQVQNAIAAVIGVENTPPYYELFSTMVEDLRADPDPQRQQIGVILGQIMNKLSPLVTRQRQQLLITDSSSGGRLREDLELIGRIRPQAQATNSYNPSFGPSMVSAGN